MSRRTFSESRALPFCKNRTKCLYRLGQFCVDDSIGAVLLLYTNPLHRRSYINLITAGQTSIIVFSNVLSVVFQMIRRLIFK